jgi:hypothetical protein
VGKEGKIQGFLLPRVQLSGFFWRDARVRMGKIFDLAGGGIILQKRMMVRFLATTFYKTKAHCFLIFEHKK